MPKPPPPGIETEFDRDPSDRWAIRRLGAVLLALVLTLLVALVVRWRNW